MDPKFLDCDGLKMPIIGFGTWQANNEEIEKALDIALTVGYRHIDTAHIYQNESAIGKVLQRWISSGKIEREDLFITTKLPFYRNKPELVEDTIKESLSNLQLDYVDLYLVHFPCYVEINADNLFELKEDNDQLAVWSKMEEQVKAGYTKKIGISNYNIKQIERILQDCTIKPAIHQFELHLYLQQGELVEYCKKNGIGIVAYSSLGSPGAQKNIDTLNEKFHTNLTLPNVLGNEVVLKLAETYSKTPAQILLRQIIQKNIAVIPKSVCEDRIKQNFDLYGFSLDSEDMAELEAQDKNGIERVFHEVAIIGLAEHPENPFR